MVWIGDSLNPHSYQGVATHLRNHPNQTRKDQHPPKACNPLASWDRRRINSPVYFVEILQYSKISRL